MSNESPIQQYKETYNTAETGWMRLQSCVSFSAKIAFCAALTVWMTLILGIISHPHLSWATVWLSVGCLILGLVSFVMLCLMFVIGSQNGIAKRPLAIDVADGSITITGSRHDHVDWWLDGQ